jgi:beta-carotene 15,15'-dioxygenase
MRRFALILFVAFELCYYLLIIQTGVVEYFSSDLAVIFVLPLGGVIGSLLSFYVKTSNENKIAVFLSLQLIVSFFYPNVSQVSLFVLGVSSGAIAPLMINELKKAQTIDIGAALGVSYAVGTLLFNYDVSQRGGLAVAFTLIVLISSRFLPKMAVEDANGDSHSLALMMVWIFLDSALFETLSRDAYIPIWRLGFSYEIVLFHLLGVAMALAVDLSKRRKETLILILFALSYAAYFFKEAALLSAIYPIAISYYNVAILRTLMKKDLKTIGIYMVFTAWLASGAGLFVALNALIGFVPIALLSLGTFDKRYFKKMETRNV